MTFQDGTDHQEHVQIVESGMAALVEKMGHRPPAPGSVKEVDFKPKPTDAERAAAFKQRLLVAHQEIARIRDDMIAEGFDWNMSWGIDANGRSFVAMLIPFKVFR